MWLMPITAIIQNLAWCFQTLDIWLSWVVQPHVGHVVWLWTHRDLLRRNSWKHIQRATAVHRKFTLHSAYLFGFALCGFNSALLKNQGWFIGLPDALTFQLLTQLHQSTFLFQLHPLIIIYEPILWMHCILRMHLHVVLLLLWIKANHSTHINIRNTSDCSPFHFHNVTY